MDKKKERKKVPGVIESSSSVGDVVEEGEMNGTPRKSYHLRQSRVVSQTETLPSEKRRVGRSRKTSIESANISKVVQAKKSELESTPSKGSRRGRPRKRPRSEIIEDGCSLSRSDDVPVVSPSERKDSKSDHETNRVTGEEKDTELEQTDANHVNATLESDKSTNLTCTEKTSQNVTVNENSVGSTEMSKTSRRGRKRKPVEVKGDTDNARKDCAVVSGSEKACSTTTLAEKGTTESPGTESTEFKTPKKRGRKRKVDISRDNTVLDVSEKDLAEIPTGKVSLDGGNSPTSTETTTGRRRRGRRKISQEDNDEDDRTSGCVRTPRSTRKPRRANSVMETTEEVDSISEKTKDEDDEEKDGESKRVKINEGEETATEEKMSASQKSSGDNKSDISLSKARKVWAEQIAETGEAKCPKCFNTRKKIASIEKHFSQCAGQTSFKFTCQHCPKGFQSTAGLKYHMLVEHSMLTPKKGSETSDTDDPNNTMVLKAIMKKLGKLKCQIEGCGKAFKTVNGYKYHVDKCGKEQTQVFNCDECGKEYQSYAGVKYHKQTAHRKPPTAEEIEKARKLQEEKEAERLASGSILSPTGRVRRQAAIRAGTRVQELAENGILLDETPKRGKHDKDPDATFGDAIKALYTKPARPVVTPAMTAEWRDILKSEGELKCRNEGCDVSYINVGSMKFHYAMCPKNGIVLENYKCLVCSKEYKSETSMKFHVQSAHQVEVISKQESDSEDDYSDCSESSIDTPDEEHDERSYKSTGRYIGSGDQSQSKRLIPLPDALTWTLKHNNKLEEVTVHPEWIPMRSDWTAVSDSERALYEPECDESIEFQIESENENIKRTKLKKYAALPTDKSKSLTLFTGGPVWSTSWCPLPVRKSTANQYAAISCHRNHEEVHQYQTVYAKKGVIQLWCFGELSDKMPESPPYLSLAIAHEYGCLWDIKWCPSGAWEESKQSENEVISRLGLLALACSDGKVRIISVPHPGQLADHKVKAFTTNPCAILSATPPSLSTNQSQCMCIDWSPDPQHRKIVAGYVNGVIALWDLHTTSPLLKTTSPTCTPAVFSPYHSFQAHSNFVSDVSWCKTSEHFLASCGADRYLNFWDLRSTSWPVNFMVRGSLTQCYWSSHWNGCCVGQDNSVTGSRNHYGVHFIETGFLQQKPLYLMNINSCIWGITFSEWLNTLATCDTVGRVIGSVLPNIYRFNKHSKGAHRSRFLVYSVAVEKKSSLDRKEAKAQKMEEQSTNEAIINSKTDSIRTTTNAADRDEENNHHMETVTMETDTCDVDTRTDSTLIVESAANRDEENNCHMEIVTMDTDVGNEQKLSDKEKFTDMRNVRSDKTRTNKEKNLECSESVLSNCDVANERDSGKFIKNSAKFSDSGNHGDGPNDAVESDGNTICVTGKSESHISETGRKQNVDALSKGNIECVDSVGLSGVQVEHNTNCGDDDEILTSRRKHDAEVGGSEIENEKDDLSSENVITRISQSTENTNQTQGWTEYPKLGADSQNFYSQPKDGEKYTTNDVPGKRTDAVSRNSQPTDDMGENQGKETNRRELAKMDVTFTDTGMKDSKNGSVLETTNEGSNKNTNSASKEKTKMEGSERLPSNYHDVDKEYCLVFHDMDVFNFDKKKTEAFKQLLQESNLSHPRPDHYPVEAINKVCWNPNLGSHQWLLSAGNSGIVRVHNVLALRKKSSNTLLMKLNRQQQRKEEDEQGEEQPDENKILQDEQQCDKEEVMMDE